MKRPIIRINRATLWLLTSAVLSLSYPGAVLAQVVEERLFFSYDKSLTDGFTPKTLEPGAPIGSFALSGFESVSLYTGKLNFALPLVQIGGRGAAGFSMMLPIQSDWTVDQRINYLEESNDGQVNATMTEVTSTFVLDGVVRPRAGLSAGRLYGRRGLSLGICEYVGQTVDSFARVSASVTRLTYVTPDGSEIELVDDDPAYVTDSNFRLGRPADNTVSCSNTNPNQHGATTFTRGRRFISMDGSAITFVADDPIVDTFKPEEQGYFVYPSGNLMFPDGTTQRIEGSQVRWIRDRNGNKVDLAPAIDPPTGEINGDLISQVTDSLGRVTTLTYDLTIAGCSGDATRIRYDGAGGEKRDVHICYEPISANGTTTETRHQLFGLMTASGDTQVPNNSVFDPRRPSWVQIPDGRKYEFTYNSYGELIRAKLPTGGAFEYDWIRGDVFGVPNVDTGDDDRNGLLGDRISRRVFRRRVCSDSQTGLSCEQHVEYHQYLLSPGRLVEAFYRGSQSGTVLSHKKHYFHSDASGSNPAGSAAWRGGREYRTDVLGGSGLLQTVLNEYDQMDGQERPWCGDAAAIFCHPNPSQQGSTPANRPRLVETTTTFNDGSPAVTARQTFDYDEFNNPTDTIEYSFSGSVVRHTQTSYKRTQDYINPATSHHNYAQVRLLRLPEKRLVCGTSGACTDGNSTARSEIVYDGGGLDPVSTSGLTGHCSNVANPQSGDPDYRCLNFGPGGAVGPILSFNNGYVIRGNATSIKAWRDPAASGSSVETTRRYDMLGNLTRETDLNGNATTVSYTDEFTQPCALPGTRLAFPTTINRPLGLTSEVEYDCGLAAPTKVTDPNGIEMEFEYETAANQLDRPLAMTQGANRTGAERLKTTFEYNDTPGFLSVKTRLSRTSFSTLNTTAVALFDGLGRTKEARQHESDTTFIATRTEYDGMGRSRRATNPFRSGDPLRWTTTTYDALSRPLTVTHPDNSVMQTAYAGPVTTGTDEAGKSRRSTVDALGRLIEVVEDPGALGYVTDYSYDLLDNLTFVDHHGSTQTRSFEYNGLSRLTSATNPESGQIRYTYDDSGNLRTRVDARQIQTTNDYDALNRLEQTGYSDSTTPWTSFTYGTTSPNKGRLTQVYRDGYATNFVYDALGRVVQSTQTVPGQTPYQFSYIYNNDGTLKSQTYHSGRVVHFAYDYAGRPVTVGLAEGGMDYLQAAAYAAHGAPSLMRLGNDVRETTSFNNRLQPTRILAEDTKLPTPTTLLDLVFSYGTTNNNGNVLSQIITRHTGVVGTQTYRYDGVNRLAIAAEGATLNSDDNCPTGVPWCRDYVYDAFGNRAATGTGIMMGHAAPRDLTQFDPANNRIDEMPTGDPLPNAYDAAGNLTNHPSIGMMAYDADNKMTSFSDGTESGSYVYDGQGNRVQRTSSTEGGVTTYVYDAFGKLAAEYSTETQGTSFIRKFRTTDHLGSTRLITLDGPSGPTVDPAGGCRDFFPFGERIPGEMTGVRSDDCYKELDQIAQQFTGMERDAESDLDYFLARYASSSLGRFMSTDPLFFQAENATDPQRSNLYGYVRNSPLRFVDPTGERIELTGDTDEERQRQLAAIRDAVGRKAGRRLYVQQDEKTGDYFVGIWGDVGKFRALNPVADDFGEIIADDENVAFDVVASRERLEIGDGSYHMLADMGGTGATTDSGPVYVFVRRPDEGSYGWSGGGSSWHGLLSHNRGIVTGHEFGHALARIRARRKGREATKEERDKGALDLENKVRRLQNGPNADIKLKHQ